MEAFYFCSKSRVAETTRKAAPHSHMQTQNNNTFVPQRKQTNYLLGLEVKKMAE